jgi:toxin secretion/phage lysis holin
MRLGGVAKWIAAAVTAVWVGMPVAAQTLAVRIGIDYATGLLNASMKKRLSSEVGWNGLKRKVMTGLLVWGAHYMTQALRLQYDMGSLAAWAFAVSELISITENAAAAGVPIPPPLLEALVKARHVTGRGVSAKEVERELAGRRSRR